jgi:histidinol-phosphate aminotransferase
MLEAVQPNTRMLFLANPNNPTGTYVSEDQLARLLRELPSDVIPIIDEAYSQYVEADDVSSALEMRELHDNLIVTRTFSKCYGLAGLRAGYAIARPEIVDLVNRVREPFNCNRLAQAAAAAALDDDDFVERSKQLNREGRAQLEAGLDELEPLGVDWIPSQTNFLLVEVPVEGRDVYQAMMRRGVIVRPVDGYGLPHHLRITIGTEAENERCLDALESALRELIDGTDDE